MTNNTQTTLCIDKPRISHSNLGSSDLFSYPSPGGHVRKEITRVELDSLGLKIPHESDTYTTDEEDSFALRMMQIGGRWWPSQKFYSRHTYGDGMPYGHHYPPDLDVGYCAEGVLVLRTWAGKPPYVEGLPDVPPEKPDAWSKLSLCATMEERCEVLREIGAVVYESVEQCPDLPDSLDEGIAQGRQYEQILKKMEDREYVMEWFETL